MAEVLDLDPKSDSKRISSLLAGWLKAGALVKGSKEGPQRKRVLTLEVGEWALAMTLATMLEGTGVEGELVVTGTPVTWSAPSSASSSSRATDRGRRNRQLNSRSAASRSSWTRPTRRPRCGGTAWP